MTNLRLFIPLLLIPAFAYGSTPSASDQLRAAAQQRLSRQEQNRRLLEQQLAHTNIQAPIADNNAERKEIETQSISQQALPEMLDCGICLDEKQPTDCVTLFCHHSYCRECLGNLVDQALREKTTAQLKCPAQGCAQQIQPEDIRTIINNDAAKMGMISEIAAREWLLMQPNVKQCPTPNCPYAFLNDDTNRQNMKCPSCKNEYCSNCLFDHSKNQTCQQGVAQRAADKNSVAWIAENTKPCPRCNTRIEKDKGCMYMTCQQCRHGFCWNCNGTHHVSVCNEPAALQPQPVVRARLPLPYISVRAHVARPVLRVRQSVQEREAQQRATLAANGQYSVNNLNFGFGSPNVNLYPLQAAPQVNRIQPQPYIPAPVAPPAAVQARVPDSDVVTARAVLAAALTAYTNFLTQISRGPQPLSLQDQLQLRDQIQQLHQRTTAAEAAVIAAETREQENGVNNMNFGLGSPTRNLDLQPQHPAVVPDELAAHKAKAQQVLKEARALIQAGDEASFKTLLTGAAKTSGSLQSIPASLRKAVMLDAIKAWSPSNQPKLLGSFRAVLNEKNKIFNADDYKTLINAFLAQGGTLPGLSAAQSISSNNNTTPMPPN